MEHLGQCVLSDTPTAAFEAFVRDLALPDYASLRVVSRSVCKRTTATIPYITLSLCQSSSIQQLQQWCQATRHFQHVTNIHVHIKTGVSAEVFEQAMQLLSQRSKPVTELHVLAVDDGSNNSSGRIKTFFPSEPVSAELETLEPIKHVITSLTTLVIKGVAVPDLPFDLLLLAEAAAAAGGLKLQRFSLSIERGKWFRPAASMFFATPSRSYMWYEFVGDLTALLKTASPTLKQLSLQIPPLGYYPDDEQEVTEWLIEDRNGEEYAEALEVLDDEDIEMSSYESEKALAAASLIAALAAISNSMLQLDNLEELTLTEIPDVWKIRDCVVGPNFQADGSDEDEDEEFEDGLKISGVALAVERAKAGGLSVSLLQDHLFSGPLTTVADAAAAFATLESCGGWLLQHHATLRQLHISTAETGWGMSWQKKQQQSLQPGDDDTNSSSMGCDSATAELCAVTANIHPPEKLYRYLRPAATDNTDSSVSGYMTLMCYCSNQGGCYSSRPVSSLVRHIVRCRLRMYNCDVPGLAKFLEEFTCLEHLMVICRAEDDDRSTPAATAAIKAAAAVSNLQSLAIYFDGPSDHMPDDVLLPLTAAQGGPGSSLTKLIIRGGFTSVAGKGLGWLHAIKLLDNLKELKLEYTGGITPKSARHYPFSVCNLPASLQVLHADRLSIVGDAAASNSSMDALVHATMRAAPELLQLTLQDCRVSDLGFLASSQLQQLTVVDSDWSGGWTAAAAAWPHVRSLVWSTVVTQKASDHGSSAGSTAQVYDSSNMLRKAVEFLVSHLAADSATAQEMFVDVPAAFPHLKSLTLQDLPWLHPQVLSTSVLQSLMQRLPMIQHLNIRALPGPTVQDGGFPGGVLDHDELVAAMDTELRSRNSSSGAAIFNLDPNPVVLQQWMQQQMYGASICLS